MKLYIFLFLSILFPIQVSDGGNCFGSHGRRPRPHPRPSVDGPQSRMRPYGTIGQGNPDSDPGFYPGGPNWWLATPDPFDGCPFKGRHKGRGRHRK